MTCTEFRIRLHPYLDGELGLAEMTATGAHRAACWACAELAQHEQNDRWLLRRQPRESVPAELRARIVAGARRQGRSPVLRPRGLAWMLAVLAGSFVAAVLSIRSPVVSMVGGLVDMHLAFAQMSGPAELASSDPGQLEAWFRQRADLRVVVPDYGPAGIRLVGGRIVATHERQAAYLLYEKGALPLSVFVLPVETGDAGLTGRPVTYRGHAYVADADRGQQTVAWTDRRASFGLVSTLPHDVLLECADRLRRERASREAL